MAQGDIYQWEWGQVSVEGGDRYQRNLQISWEGCRYQWKSGQMSVDDGKDICQFVKLFIVFLAWFHLVRSECNVDLFENSFQVEVKIRVKEEAQEWTERDVRDIREGHDFSHGDFKIKEEKLEKIKIKRTHSPSEVKDRDHKDHRLERASSIGSQESRGSWRSPEQSTKLHDDRGVYYHTVVD